MLCPQHVVPIISQKQMNNYNPNIHHRRSIRLKGYDYSQAGFYFITIDTKDRVCLFGKIVMVENFQPSMVLNNAGKIADEGWLEIPIHFPNAVLHEHIVMPNHIHGIIELIKSGSHNDSESNNGVQIFEPQPIWQRNYYEHIIRDEKSFQRISDYIINNPKNWHEDKFFNK
jgi:putative transposase